MRTMALLLVVLFLAGCGAKIMKRGSLPQAKRIAVLAFSNYTDTPEAGKRAANIVAGVLRARGFEVVTFIDDTRPKSMERLGIAYYVQGGVSEWRYKTGIDGEPAVSLQIAIVDVKSGEVVWSAVGSDNSWGNASLGVVAQKMIENMF